jgi:hypothetical protein
VTDIAVLLEAWEIESSATPQGRTRLASVKTRREGYSEYPIALDSRWGFTNVKLTRRQKIICAVVASIAAVMVLVMALLFWTLWPGLEDIHINH